MRSQDLDDLVQHCLLTLWAKRSLINDGKAEAFLYGIAHKVQKAHNRRMIKHLKGTEKMHLAVRSGQFRQGKIDADAVSKLVHEEQAERIEKLIQQLPPRMGEVIKLRYLKNLSREEIADRMQIALNTVYKFEYRALRRLLRLPPDTTNGE